MSVRIRVYLTRLPQRSISQAQSAQDQLRSFISFSHLVVLTKGPTLLYEFASIYIFSNTAKYLFTHLRDNLSLLELAANTSIHSLVSEFNQRIMKDQLSLEDIVVGYIILVAISLKDLHESRLAYEQLELDRLEWGKFIARLGLDSAQITDYQYISMKPILSIMPEPGSSSSDNYKLMTTSPKIESWS